MLLAYSEAGNNILDMDYPEKQILIDAANTISKVSVHAQAILHMPSMTAIRLNPTLKPFYERLKAKKVKPLIALVAVQRKMLILMYSLWKKSQYYDFEFEQKKAARNKILAAQDRNKNEFVTS